MEQIELAFHEEVLRRLGTEWAKVTTDFSNEILERCEELAGEVEGRIKDIVEEYKDEVKLEEKA